MMAIPLSSLPSSSSAPAQLSLVTLLAISAASSVLKTVLMQSPSLHSEPVYLVPTFVFFSQNLQAFHDTYSSGFKSNLVISAKHLLFRVFLYSLSMKQIFRGTKNITSKYYYLRFIVM